MATETSTVSGNLHVKARLSAASMTIPANTIANAAVASDAAIAAEKIEHAVRATYRQKIVANAAAEGEVVHVARAAGTVEAFEVGLVTPPDTASGGGGRTAIFDLKKNGTTVLSGTVTLNSTNTAYTPVAATIGSAAYVDGDVFTVVVTLGVGTTGTHAIGVFAHAVFHELPL